MYHYIVLFLFCSKISNSFGNPESPWNYFDKTQGSIAVDFSSPPNNNDFVYSQDSKVEVFSPPAAETGFVPSFGKFTETRPVPTSQTFGHPMRPKHQQRYPHRNLNVAHHKNPLGRPTNIIARYQTKPLPVVAKYSSNIYKPSFIAGSHLSKLREDPTYFKIRANVNAQGHRLKGKEKYPNGVNGDILNQQQDEYYEPKHEKHVPQNEPHYYTKPQGQVINYDRIQQKNKYPLPNYGNIKINPQAYNPLKGEINLLRQKQHKTFSEGNNEYPGAKTEEKPEEDEIHVSSGGQDILRNQENYYNNQNKNFDNNFSKFAKKHHPGSKFIPTSDEGNNDDNVNTGADFIPIRTYAQVRHSESIKHLPKEAAYEDAETFDEVLNAPRLREAVKTSKAQTVYTEEGYEDVAYDHAGHLKHASNQEGYSGYLRGKHDSGKAADAGKNSGQYNSGGKSKHGLNISKGKKWSTDEGANEQFDNKNSFNLRDGEYESTNSDLTGAGSIKLSLNDNEKFSASGDFSKLPPKEHYRSRTRHKTRGKYNGDSKTTESQNTEVSTKSRGNNRDFKDRIKHVNVIKNDSKKIEKLEDISGNDSPLLGAAVIGKIDSNGQRHGGNYKLHPLLENKNSTRIVNQFKNKNLVSNSSPNSGSIEDLSEEQPPEVIKFGKIDPKAPHHGGNYKVIPISKTEDFVVENESPFDVEVFGEILPNAPHHGGNYKVQPISVKNKHPSEFDVRGGNYKIQPNPKVKDDYVDSIDMLRKKFNSRNKNTINTYSQKGVNLDEHSLGVVPLPDIIYGNKSDKVSKYVPGYRVRPISNERYTEKKPNEDDTLTSEALDDVSLDNNPKQDVEVLCETKPSSSRHGGNYRWENDTQSEINGTKLTSQSKLCTSVDSSNTNGHANGAYKKEPSFNEQYDPSNSEPWVGFRKDLTRDVKSASNGDQIPVTSDVEIFKSDFVVEDSPKHGGNYRKVNGKKKTNKSYSNLEDFESPSKYLHGGNYKNIQKIGKEADRDSAISSEFMDEGLPQALLTI